MTSFWSVLKNLKVGVPIEPTDAKFVDTQSARGDLYWRHLLSSLGINPVTKKLEEPIENEYLLLAGHIGCGKSSELRRLVSDLHKNSLYLVIFVDSETELDPSDLRYIDLLLHLAAVLCRTLDDHNIEIPDVFLTRLKNWTAERIISQETTLDVKADVSAGVQAKTGIPFLGSIFAKLTTKISTGATQKEQIRQTVQDSFTEFADGFNELINKAQEALATREDLPNKIVFIVDGTDRLKAEDTTRLFTDDVHQLKKVHGVFVYSVNIDTIHENNRLKSSFQTFEVPMIKTADRDGTPHDIGLSILREMVVNRIPRELFDTNECIDKLIEASGGHPRDLVRLLNYAHQAGSSKEIIDMDAAETAIMLLRNDYAYFLTKEDFETLAQVDLAQNQVNSAATQRLLRESALLQYNAFFWRSHPVVRDLPAYKEARRDHAVQ